MRCAGIIIVIVALFRSCGEGIECKGIRWKFEGASALGGQG